MVKSIWKCCSYKSTHMGNDNNLEEFHMDIIFLQDGALPHLAVVRNYLEIFCPGRWIGAVDLWNGLLGHQI